MINPTDEERARAKLDIVVSGGEGCINMLEGKAKEVSEERFLEAVELALMEINSLNKFQNEIAREIQKEIYQSAQQTSIIFLTAVIAITSFFDFLNKAYYNKIYIWFFIISVA